MEKTIKPDTSTSWQGLRIALVYAAVGALWIIFSDLAVELIFGRTRGMFWAEVLKGLVFVASSALLIFFLTNRTIHSIRKSEEALKRSEEIYRALVEGTSDAIFMVDRARCIISVNQGFVELFGYSREELEGKSIRILHPSDQSYDDFGKAAYPALEKAPLRIEWEMKKKDGTVFPGEGTYSVIRGPDGSARGHVGIVRDITQRKKAENELEEYREHLEEMVAERTHELEEAQKALVQREKLKTLGTVAAEVAHEIRNPLVSIGGFARRLQRKNPDAHEAEIILQESGRLETMLNRLSEYLRPVEMRPREAYVNTILNESVSLLAPELEKEKVAVHLDFQPDLATAHVDPTVLAQIFVVMIRNALQMMNSEKDLTLRTYHGEHSVYVEMISSTEGKKVADPELMLLPFEDKGRATGFSSTFKLLKGMGGTLSFSRYNGKAVFTVSLVKCREEEHQPAHRQPDRNGLEAG